MGKVFQNIIDTIGKTPLVKLNKITENVKPAIYAKIEAFNPGENLVVILPDTGERYLSTELYQLIINGG